MPAHGKHFRETHHPPDSPPLRTFDQLEILGWDLFVYEGEPSPLFAPIVRHDGREVHASNRVFCNVCRRWLAFAGSVTHYKAHAGLHARAAAAAEATDAVTVAIYSFALSRGEPLSVLDFLRRTPLQEAIPSAATFRTVAKALQCRLKEALRQRCLDARHVNLAVDGWSDPRGRRYQGITARLIFPDTSVTVCLLALKEIKSIHESAQELRTLVETIKNEFLARANLINICTDRCAMNEKAFRRRSTPIEALIDDGVWIPCVCHLLNNLLGRFLESIQDVVRPVFRLQQRFRKNASFLAFLEQRNAVLESIPSYSVVRWYSSNALFKALLNLWQYMVDFAATEGLATPELCPTVYLQIQRLSNITDAFKKAQKELEGDEFGSGSHFIGRLLSLQYHVGKFVDTHPQAVQDFNTYIQHFKAEYEQEYQLFLLMTFLDPSVQFELGRTCSPAEFRNTMSLLSRLIAARMRAAPPEAPDDSLSEPKSDDFTTYVASGPGYAVAPEQQIDLYKHIRSSCLHAKKFWCQAPPELTQLSDVAFRILGLLTTSASVERAFSVARAICTEYQMAQKQETVSCRVLIRANWNIAEPLLKDVLALSPRIRSQIADDMEPTTSDWRLRIHEE